MKQNFKLPFEKQNDVVNNLLVEISNTEISMLVYSTFPFTVNGYYNYINCDFNSNTESALSNIFNESNINANDFEKVKVFYNFSESTLVPSSFFNETDVPAISELMFGESLSKTNCFEKIQNFEIVNVFRVPNNVKKGFQNFFPKYNYAHSNSYQIKNDLQNVLRCIVYDNQIKIILNKDGNFVNVIYQNYTSAEDVCYHLLNVCERYKIDTNTIDLLLEGKIEIASKLYNEIYKFIANPIIVESSLNIEFATIMTGIQIHYFEHLINLAKCEL